MNKNRRNIFLAIILTFIMTVSLFSFVSCGLVNVTFNITNLPKNAVVSYDLDKSSDDIKVEIAMQHTDSYAESTFSYVNNIQTPDGGTHEIGFKSGLTKALSDLNIKIDNGEFVFVVGASGAGKSTFLKLMMREEVPTSGSVEINGYQLNHLKKREIPYFRRTLGIVFQDFRLIPSMNVYDNIAYAMRVIGARETEIRKRVPYLLGLVGLNSKARSFPNQLSGGEQQRVALARALANNASMIIADEPTGNIDPRMSYDIVNLLNHINSDGTTVIMVTHDYHLVKSFNHRVITIKNGKVESDYPDASHIDVEPYHFDNAEDEVGTYYSDDTTVDFDYLMKTYGVETVEVESENPFVDIPTEPANFHPTDSYSVFGGEDSE